MAVFRLRLPGGAEPAFAALPAVRPGKRSRCISPCVAGAALKIAVSFPLYRKRKADFIYVIHQYFNHNAICIFFQRKRWNWMKIRLIGKKAGRNANNIDFSAGNLPFFPSFPWLVFWLHCPAFLLICASVPLLCPFCREFLLVIPWKNRAFY